MYKILVQKKDKGSQLGLTNCVLNNEFNPKIFYENYGVKPWYNYKKQSEKNLEDNMFLICKLNLVNYEIRSLTENYYVVSDDLKKVLESFNIYFLEESLLKIVNIKGESIANRNYSVVRFKDNIIKDPIEVLYQESYYIKDRRIKFRDIKIKDKIDYPIFKIKDIDETISCFFISSDLEREIRDSTPCSGIDFINADAYPWSSTATSKYLRDMNSDKSLILIN